MEEGVETEHKVISGEKHADDLESQWQEAMGSLEKVLFHVLSLLRECGRRLRTVVPRHPMLSI